MSSRYRLFYRIQQNEIPEQGLSRAKHCALRTQSLDHLGVTVLVHLLNPVSSRYD